LLGKRQRNGRDDPADLHDRHKASLDGGLDLVISASARNQGHGDQVHGVLDGRDLRALVMSQSCGSRDACLSPAAVAMETYNQVADENLHDLRLQALATLEELLQDANQEVAEGRADQGAVNGHLGHARGEVVAALALVMGNPRGEELLQTRKSARGEHLGAQRVRLQLPQVGLALSRQYVGAYV
jgi:hypothetical protein